MWSHEDCYKLNKASAARDEERAVDMFATFCIPVVGASDATEPLLARRVPDL